MMDQLREEELAALTREHERALAAQDKECRGILGAAKALLPPDELEKVTRIAYLASIGKAAGTVADMEPRRRRDLGMVASVLVEAVLCQAKGGEPGPLGVLEVTLARRNAAQTVLGRSMLEAGCAL